MKYGTSEPIYEKCIMKRLCIMRLDKNGRTGEKYE